jgi:hypothetical protein
LSITLTVQPFGGWAKTFRDPAMTAVAFNRLGVTIGASFHVRPQSDLSK